MMKKRTKENLENLGLFAVAILFLLCGCWAWEIGQEGKAICLFFSSLYITMWVHAGIVAMLINAKFEDKKGETSDSVTVEKHNSTRAEN